MGRLAVTWQDMNLLWSTLRCTSQLTCLTSSSCIFNPVIFWMHTQACERSHKHLLSPNSKDQRADKHTEWRGGTRAFCCTTGVLSDVWQVKSLLSAWMVAVNCQSHTPIWKGNVCCTAPWVSPKEASHPTNSCLNHHGGQSWPPRPGESGVSKLSLFNPLDLLWTTPFAERVSCRLSRLY